MTTTSKPSKPFMGQRGGWLLFWLTFACATDMTLFGYDQAVFSGVVINDNFLTLHDLVNRTTILSTVTAIYNIGCFLGAIVAFTLGERLGRKKAIIFGTIIMTVGAILQASSFSLAQMFVGRTILGIGNGINTSVAPIWQTETSPAKWRGMLVIIEMMMNIAGFTMCNWINYGTSFDSGSFAWRFPLALQLVFNILLFATVPWLPESPRWLLAHDREEEARLVISSFENKEVDDPRVIAQCNEVLYAINYEMQHQVSWMDLLRNRTSHASDGGADTKTVRRLLLGAGTQFMQQFEGINIMSYYLPTVLTEAVGLETQTARLITGINATTYLIFSCLSIPFVERWGRRTLMLVSTAGQGLSFLIITILLRYAENNKATATASIPFFFIYYIAFGVGMLGVPWLYPTEINSLPMRTKGASLATATNWITNFVIVEITPIGIRNLGWKFWIVWTIFNAIFLPVIYFLYPETANRTLEDLDDYYRTNPSLIVTTDKDAICTKRPAKYVLKEEEEIDRVRRRSIAEREEKDGAMRFENVTPSEKV